jgi:hypothetical protein
MTLQGNIKMAELKVGSKCHEVFETKCTNHMSGRAFNNRKTDSAFPLTLAYWFPKTLGASRMYV